MKEPTDLFSPKELEQLTLTTKVRRRIIQTLTEKNELPTNADERKFLINALDGMDRAVFTKARLRSQVDASQDTGEAVRIIGKLLYNAQAAQLQQTLRTDPPLVPKTIQVKDPVPGEMDQHPAQRTIDTFYKELKAG